MPKSSSADTELLRAALIGYEASRNRIQRRIAELKAQLRAPSARVPDFGVAKSSVRKSRMSAAGRARIAAAQRKRWAAMKAAK